jgi:hydroxymethylpyrimidine pyrophosphatase-like HAD family hydrolase
MRYHALVTDYDLTIAEDSVVSDQTIKALERVRGSGRSLIMVTGRELDDLLRVFPRIDLFDRVVAENGALLYRPATGEQRLLAEPPPAEFTRAVRAAGISPLCEGRVIVATLRPHEIEILGIIRDLGLELHVIFNHTAVMVLPSGTNKASGLQEALLELGLSPHNCVGVGDAENDHAFLSYTGCSVAVGNALDALKKHMDFVTQGGPGKGVEELIDLLIESDLGFLDSVARHQVPIGIRPDGSEVTIGSYDRRVLVAGTAGAGKSARANTFLEKLSASRYQFCILDPAGDYLDVEGTVILGDRERPPSVPEVMELLVKPSENVVVNLLGIPAKERPTFFESLLHRIHELRARTGRPHWLIMDETQHVLPSSSSWNLPGPTVREGGLGVMMITVEPDKLPRTALEGVDLLVTIGDNPGRTLEMFSDAVGQPAPLPSDVQLNAGEALGWFWKTGEDPFTFRGLPPKGERQRHRRKYAEGELAPELCFYFRGPDNKLNLKVQNLSVFLQIADGVDEETWLHHLKTGELSTWFRNVIKDEELASEIRRFETRGAGARESRAHIRSEIEKRYMAAA